MKTIIQAHWKFLGLTLVFAFLSGSGQSFFLALFNPAWLERYDISMAKLSTLYGSATLVSALILPFIGRMVDRVSLVQGLLRLSTALLLAVILLAWAPTVTWLFFGFLGVRMLGQSSLPLAVMTHLGKVFGSYRGKATSIFTLGRSAAEGLLPLVAVAITTGPGLETGLMLFAGGAALIAFPTLFLLSRLPESSTVALYEESEQVRSFQKQLELKDVIRLPSFYFLILANVVLPFVMTSIYFHADSLLKEFSWSQTLWASSFIMYSLAMVVSNFTTGFLVDRFTATRVVFWHAIFVGIGLVVPLYFAGNWTCVFFLVACGFSIGVSMNSKSAIMMELYGSTALGSIKSLSSTIVVISTSISPIFATWLIEDYGTRRLMQVDALMAIGSAIVYIIISLRVRRQLRQK